MPEERQPRRPWFHLITQGILDQSGPGFQGRQGADVYAGQPSPKVGDSLTKDVLAEAEKFRNG